LLIQSNPVGGGLQKITSITPFFTKTPAYT